MGTHTDTITTDQLSAEQWDALLHLLGAIVLTDRHVSGADITSMWCALQDVSGEAGLSPNFSRNQVGAWVGVRAQDILDAIEGKEEGEAAANWVEAKLVTLRDHPVRGDIFRALEAAMLSDRNVCNRRFDGILLASEILGQDASARFTSHHRKAACIR